METCFTIEELADYLKIAANVIIQNNIHSRTWRSKLTPDIIFGVTSYGLAKQDKQERLGGLQSANCLLPPFPYLLTNFVNTIIRIGNKIGLRGLNV